MKKALLLILLLPALYFNTMAQSANSLALPSPNNRFLGKVNSGSTKVSVDLYTGTALVNIPICKLSSKSLTVPVSLNYMGGRGIKVQDYATMVGLGWQLNAGGSISRVVRCFPDEMLNGYLGTGLWGQVIQDRYANGIPWTSAQTKAIRGEAMDYPTADGEPDIYYVKTPYFAFQFTFDENGHPVFSKNKGIKIISKHFYNSLTYNGSSFEVIDAKGNKYYFGSSLRSKENTTTKLFGTNKTFTTTWYLDKVVSYNQKDSILFEYSSPTSNDITYHYRKITSYDGYHLHTDSTPIERTIINPTVVSRIVSPLGEIELTYNTDRLDDPNAPRLSKVVLKAYDPNSGLNEAIKYYNFKYSYFGAPATDSNQLRLKLDSITVSGGTLNSPDITFHSFIYDMDVNLPSRKNLYMIDYFGYYSSLLFIGSLSNPYCRPIEPEITHTKANILTGIKTLTGTKYNISYELNTYDSSGHNIAVGGLRVNKISKIQPQGDTMYRVYKYDDNNGHSTGEILSDSYLESTWYGDCGILKIFSESTSDYYDLNGNYVGYSSVKVLEKNGGYQIVDFSNFLTPGCNDILDYTNVGSYAYFIPNVTTSISSAYKRGLPLNKRLYDASDNIISKDTFIYTSLTDPITKSSWAYHWIKISFSLPGYSCSERLGAKYWTKVENYRLTQTIHKDYDLQNPTNFIQTTTNYTYAPDKRKIRSITTTDSKGDIHTQTFYYADDNSIPMVTITEQQAINAMVNDNRTDVLIHKIDNQNGTIHQIHYSYAVYPYGYNNKIYLGKTQYFTGNDLQRQVFLNYNATTSQVISSHSSYGKPTSIMYGYHASLPVAKVVNATNTISYENQVVATGKTSYIPPNDSENINIEFTTAASGTITVFLPPGSYLGSSGVNCSFGISLSGPVSRSGNICRSSSSNYSCSAPSTVSFQNMPAGTYTLTAYVYTNTAMVDVPVDYEYLSYSMVENHQKGFYYEGFEEALSADHGGAHTGRSYWDGDSRTAFNVNYAPPDSRTYMMQWWKLVNGHWTMNEAIYTGPQSLPGKIDDIRIFPSDALMTTYTYDPLIGITSELDPDGHSLSYEYDGLGRLVVTRDDDGNIISKNCYHIAGQPEGCNVYYNTVQGHTFTRNNCTNGSTGSTVLYIVAAGTYASTISQEDADQQAQDDVNSNGQAYANAHGTCSWWNVQKSGTFTRNNCTSGTGSTVVYTVPSHTYSSTISQADANQKAQSDVNTNGQSYANVHGACMSEPIQIYARLEAYFSYRDSTSYSNQYGGTNYDYSQMVRVNIRFYSDAACTQPYTLTHDVDFTIREDHIFETESSYDHTHNILYNGIIEAGTHDFFFDDILIFESFWGATDSTTYFLYYEKTSNNYDLEIGGGMIVAPSIHPDHSTGYKY